MMFVFMVIRCMMIVSVCNGMRVMFAMFGIVPPTFPRPEAP